MKKLHVPDPALVGAFRGDPGLEDAEVHVEGIFGVPAKLVPQHLQHFEVDLLRQVAALDALVPFGELPSPSQLTGVLTLCAWTHAEWVRIHPFGNGNGRVARLWVNWLAMRYALPPFLRLRPRPDAGYDEASFQAMQGDWHPTLPVIRQLFTAFVSSLATP